MKTGISDLRICIICGKELDNVQIVCSSYNMAKGTNTMQDFIDYCNFISKRFYRGGIK